MEPMMTTSQFLIYAIIFLAGVMMVGFLVSDFSLYRRMLYSGWRPKKNSTRDIAFFELGELKVFAEIIDDYVLISSIWMETKKIPATIKDVRDVTRDLREFMSAIAFLKAKTGCHRSDDSAFLYYDNVYFGFRLRMDLKTVTIHVRTPGKFEMQNAKVEDLHKLWKMMILSNSKDRKERDSVLKYSHFEEGEISSFTIENDLTTIFDAMMRDRDLQA